MSAYSSGFCVFALILCASFSSDLIQSSKIDRTRTKYVQALLALPIFVEAK